jgi:hypothetical protein
VHDCVVAEYAVCFVAASYFSAATDRLRYSDADGYVVDKRRSRANNGRGRLAERPLNAARTWWRCDRVSRCKVHVYLETFKPEA